MLGNSKFNYLSLTKVMITDQEKLFNHNSNTKFRLEDSIPNKKIILDSIRIQLEQNLNLIKRLIPYGTMLKILLIFTAKDLHIIEENFLPFYSQSSQKQKLRQILLQATSLF